jgi:glycosyltransferase involved in cell wall biosynthesis
VASIMLVSTASSIGGMERIVCGLARGLTSTGAMVHTFFPESQNSDELLRWCADQGVRAETHPAVLDAAAPHSLHSARMLQRLIAQVDPDIVNLHYGDNFLSLWDIIGARSAGAKRPVVASVHHPTAWTKSSRRKRLMTALGARATHEITTFASATRDVLLSAGVPKRRITIIPCGVRVPDRKITRAEARRTLEISDDTFVVGTLARLIDYKGVDKLIEATDCIELSETVLLVGGEGPLRPELERQASSCRHVDVRFLGRLQDVGLLFAACDLFALPSRLEGFGLVYVEAAMYGVPSIATRVGGVPDAVLDRQTGLLVDPGDVEALRDGLIELKSNTHFRERLAVAARRRAVEELDETTMVRRFAELFQTRGVALSARPR